MLKLKTIIAPLALAISVSGCVSLSVGSQLDDLYNRISTGESEFDGRKHVRMSHMLCPETTLLEVYQDTPKAQKGTVLLLAGVSYAENIKGGMSLEVKADNKVFSYSTNDVTTDYSQNYFGVGGGTYSHKTYIVKEDDIRVMANAETLMVRLHLLNGTYVESKCSDMTLQESLDMFDYAGTLITQKTVDAYNEITTQKALTEFLEVIDSTNW